MRLEYNNTLLCVREFLSFSIFFFKELLEREREICIAHAHNAQKQGEGKRENLKQTPY